MLTEFFTLIVWLGDIIKIENENVYYIEHAHFQYFHSIYVTGGILRA